MEKPFTQNTWSPDFENFQRAMNSDDPLVYVVRLHLEVERHIGTLLEELTPLRQKDFRNFHSKILVLRAVGIPSWILEWAEILNRARNRVAHRMNIEPTEILNFVCELNTCFHKHRPNLLNVSFENDEHGNSVPKNKQATKYMLLSGLCLCRYIVFLRSHENADLIRAMNGGNGWEISENE